MVGKFACLLAVVTTLGAAGVVAEGETTGALGTLTMTKTTYPLKHAVAYETNIDNEDAIALLLTGQAVSSEKLNEARDAEKEGGDPDFTRPFLKLVFTKMGALKSWSAAAGGAMLGRHSSEATGELKLQNGRVSGKASQAMESAGMIPSGFEVHFDLPLLKAGESPAASAAKKGGPAAKVKPAVTGVFKGNGNDAKLAYVSAHWGEPFNDKAGIVLVFTEKDHSKDDKPDFHAAFGKFGSALIISLFEDGQIYGCQVVHSAHSKQGFSAIGQIEAPDFTYADGKVEGQITTSGQLDTFGETWEVNLKFVASLGEIPKELQPAEPKAEKTAEASAQSTTDESGDDRDNPASKPPGAQLKVKDLSLTKDATGIEYAALVEHVLFKSKSGVKNVCGELAANLKAQGWANDGSDMVNPQSSILKRKRGEASLTIFVKPSNGGSEVKMMTEGLAWEDQ